MRINIQGKTLPVLTGAMGAIVALTLAAPPAVADPEIPVPPPPPLPTEELQAQAAPADPGLPPSAEVESQAAPADSVPPAEAIPHLVSLENLPPGTSLDPVEPQRSRGLAYLRDLWHAVQTQEVSGSDALLLLTQRPLDPNAAPPPGLRAGPQPPQPTPPAPEPVPEPEPAP